jgi:hypothetical protein
VAGDAAMARDRVAAAFLGIGQAGCPGLRRNQQL